MVSKKIVYLIFMFGSILSPVACSALSEGMPVSGAGEIPGANENLANTRWRLVSYGEPGSETPVMEGTDVTLQFEDGSQAGGSSGCNTFGAKYEVKAGNNLSITKVVSTLIACSEENVMEQEKQYLDALQSANSFEISGNNLKVRYGDGQGVLNFSRITSKIPNSVYL